MFKTFFSKFNKDLGVDLGTANTLIYVAGQGIKVNEPTVVAINNRTGAIITVGHEARNMVGKTPPFINTVKPLSKGIISDFEVAEKMLKYFFEQIGKEKIFPFRPRVVIAVPLDLTEVEKKAVEDAALGAGAKEVFLVESVIAGALGARLPIHDSIGSMIVDIGAGKTEIAVLSLNGVVKWRTIALAGEELNQNIIQYARENLNLILGEKVAEEIKIKIGSACELKEPLEYPMRGRDLLTGLPKEINVTDRQIREAMAKTIKSIIENIKLTLEVTPPELTSDIYERGLVLAGGTALLKGLDKVIREATEIPVRIADDPLTIVARGLGILLENEALLKEVALPSAKENISF